MSLHTNATGCTVSVSDMTGDVVCQRPGPECDCLISAVHYCESCEEAGARDRGGYYECDECAAEESAPTIRESEQEAAEHRAEQRREMFRGFGWSVTDPA